MAAEVIDAAVPSKSADAANDRAVASAPEPLSVRTYWVITGVVTALAFGFRVWFGSKGYFWGDDLLLRDSALDASGPGFLFEVHGGHVNVIGAAVQWVMLHTFTNSYLVTVLWSAALLAGTQIALATLFLRLQGPSWVGIVASSFAVLTLFTVEISTWWSVGKYAAPLMLGTALSLLALVAYLEAPSRRRALWVVAAFVLCVLSATKGAAVLFLLWGMAGALPIGCGEPRGFWKATRRFWKLWALLLAVAAGCVALVALGESDAGGGALTLGALASFTFGTLRDAVIPAAWGGPWTWFTVNWPDWPGWQVGPAPSPDARNYAMALTVLALTGVLLVRPVLWRWVLVVLAFVAGSVAIVGLGRAGTFFAVPVMRYVYDAAIPVAMLLALALRPTRWEAYGWSGAAANELRRWHAMPVLVRRAVAATAVLLITISAIVSYRAPVKAVGNVFAKTYITNALQTSDQANKPLLSQLAPGLMGMGSAADYVRSFDGAPQFAPVVYDRLLGLSVDGRVEEQPVRGAEAPPGPWPECGYLIGTDPIEIPISVGGALGYTVQLDYGTTAPVRLNVRTGGSERELDLPQGRGSVFFGSVAPATPVVLRATAPGTVACVSKLVIGQRIGTGLDGPTQIATIP